MQNFLLEEMSPPEEYVEGLGPCHPPGSDKKEVHIFPHQGLKSRNIVSNLMTTNTRSPWQVVQSPAPKIVGHWLLDNLGPYLVQHYFAALSGKRFLLSDIT